MNVTTRQKTTLAVEGMSCPSCIRHIREALGALEGVEGVNVQLDRGRVVVSHDPQAAQIPALVAALEDAGYAAKRVEGSGFDGER